MGDDIMKRAIFVTFKHKSGMRGTIYLDTGSVSLSNGDVHEWTTLTDLADNPSVTSIQFTED